MRNLKRTLSLLLALVMVLGTISVITFTVSADGGFAVTVASTGHGSVSASKTANVQEGETVTLTTSATDSHYMLRTLTVMQGDTAVETTEGENGTYTFEMPAGDVTVTPVLQRRTYAITVSHDPQANDVFLTGTREAYRAAKDDDVIISVRNGVGYAWDVVTVTDSHGEIIARFDHADRPGSLSFTMPAEPVTVTVHANADLKYLTRALYAYSQAAIAIKG